MTSKLTFKSHLYERQTIFAWFGPATKIFGNTVLCGANLPMPSMQVLSRQQNRIEILFSTLGPISVFCNLFSPVSPHLTHLCCSYPQNCFSPTQLKNFLARVQSTEPNCSIEVSTDAEQLREALLTALLTCPACVQVSHTKMCPSSGHELSKEFAPHLWTEFTESIDVVGARKNRIESAQNISDVLEVSRASSSLSLEVIFSTIPVFYLKREPTIRSSANCFYPHNKWYFDVHFPLHHSN